MALTRSQKLALWARKLVGRTPKPEQLTQIYPRLVGLGRDYTAQRPLIKPTPANLRMFAKTTFARRGINRIKNPIAALGWEIVPLPGVKLNSELQRQIDAVTGCLEQPNDDDSFRSFVEKLTTDLLVGGAAPYEHALGPDIRPLWMWPVDVLSIQVYAAWDGSPDRPRYSQTLGYGNIGGVQGIQLCNDELVYVRADPATDSPFSMGSLETAFAAINRKLGVSDYAGNLASNAQPENLMAFKGADDSKLRALRSWWRNDIEGQGMTPMVGMPEKDGIQILKLRGTDDKALFLDYQTMLVSEIATSFDLQPFSLGVTGDANRSIAEVMEDIDWDSAIKPRAMLIAAYITRESIQRKLGFSQLMFRFKGLEREDEVATSEIYETYYKNNVFTPNEQRAKIGVPPSTSQWADMYFADVQIAIAAARGAAQVDDPELKPNTPSPNKPAPSRRPPTKEKQRGN